MSRHSIISTMAVVSIVALEILTVGWPSRRSALRPVYDPKSGTLERLEYDANADGRVDTWSYMDGAKFARIEVDRDGNGVVDRWEHYSPEGTLGKVGISRVNDGGADAWAYPGADGTLDRLELLTRRDGGISLVESYVHGSLAGLEEETDGDGTLDGIVSAGGSAGLDGLFTNTAMVLIQAGAGGIDARVPTGPTSTPSR